MGDRTLSEWGSTSTAGRIAVAAVGVFSGVPFRSIPFWLAFGWGLLETRPCGMATRGVVKAKGDDVM